MRRIRSIIDTLSGRRPKWKFYIGATWRPMKRELIRSRPAPNAEESPVACRGNEEGGAGKIASPGSFSWRFLPPFAFEVDSPTLCRDVNRDELSVAIRSNGSSALRCARGGGHARRNNLSGFAAVHPSRSLVVEPQIFLRRTRFRNSLCAHASLLLAIARFRRQNRPID